MTTTERRPGQLMTAEIAEQPQVFQTVLDQQLEAIRAVAAQIRRRQPRFVLLAARGTSDHAALYAKYLIEIVLGLPCGLASPSTMTAYRSRPELAGALWITVSQSGGSPDLVESTAVAGDCGALTLAVTNAPQSPLARAATLSLDVAAGHEAAVAATKSYTAQLLTLHLLVDAWAGGAGESARPLPHLAAQVLTQSQAADTAVRLRFADRIVATGRGYSHPTARETALKLMETSYVSAHAFSGADLMHGPFAMIDRNWPVIAFADHGVGGAAMEPVLRQLQSDGADLTVVGAVPDAMPAAAGHIPIPDGLADSLTPVLQILPMQQLALALAVARGHDPDAPRGLRKTTATL